MKILVFFVVWVAIFVITECAIKINPWDYPHNCSVDYCEESPQQQSQVVKHEFQQLARDLEPVVKALPQSGCREQFQYVLNGLRNASLWAVQMLDASAKMPIGLIVANNYQLGHYDECIQIDTEHVKGKYCIVDIKFRPKVDKYPDYYNGYVENQFSLHYDPHKPVWEKFKLTADPSKRRRDIFHNGVCVPHKCTAADVQFLAFQLSLTMSQKTGYELETFVNEASCSTNEDKTMTYGGWVVMYTIVLFFVSVIICTAWDVSRNRKNANLSRFEETLESFSMHRNMARLSQPDASYEMNVFHGMKFYSIALIILGHRCVQSYGAPFFNPQFLEERYRKFQDMFLLNGSLIVDTFFVIGGYLTCYALLKEAEKGRKIKPVQVYLYRWLRITPMYMLVVFFYAFLIEHMGSGPIWGLKVGREAARCRDNWWANLFYINNYINNKTMCMFQSWYVSCDMHFTLIAPFVVIALVKNPKKGLTFLTGIIATATLIPFLYTYYYKFDGVLRVYMQIFEDLPQNLTFATMYIKSHHRAAPYFIGMAAAYLFTILQKNNFKFSKWMIWTGSLISTFLSIWAIWGAWNFYIPGRKYDPLENAVYSAVHRLAWGVAMAWIPVAGGRRAFGIIQPILAKQALAPLSRLSFGAFLVHGAVQLYLVGSMRLPEYIFFPKLFWMAAGDLMFSFFIAFLLHIVFEAPVQGILKLIFSPRKTGNRRENTSSATSTPNNLADNLKSQ